MTITITDTDIAFYISIALFFITFLPHIYLFLIFAIMSVVELFEYLAKSMNKFIRFTLEYIFPISIIFLIYLAILKTLILAVKSIFMIFKHVYYFSFCNKTFSFQSVSFCNHT